MSPNDFEDIRKTLRLAQRGRVTISADFAFAALRRIEAALDIAEGYIRACRDNGDEGAAVALRMMGGAT